MSKTILMNDDARRAILSGVERLSAIVSVTMGPKGRNVIVGKMVGAPTITKDGVSVAREVVLDDPIEELGCQLVKEVAGRTADVVGDGTTTATVLAHEIFKNGTMLIAAGHSPLSIRDGIRWAKDKVVLELEKLSRPVASQDDLVNIASISANNDYSIGGIIADAFEIAGWDGTVAVEASPGQETTIRCVDGIEIDSGVISGAFLSGEKSDECSFDNCRILVYNGELTHISDCLDLFNTLSKDNVPLLIIARDVRQEALTTLVANKKLGRLKCVCVATPPRWRNTDMWLEDIAGLTGGVVLGGSGKSLHNASIGDMGIANRVVVTRTSTKILGGAALDGYVDSRAEIYRRDIKKLLGDFDRKEVKDRLAMLNSKAAVISVGYSTELELREKGDRIDDAMSATKVAIEGGILPGGGVALLRAAASVDVSELDDSVALSAKILLDACTRPLSQICINAGINPGIVCSDLANNSDNPFYGYNAATNVFGDMYDMGIVDPLMVTKAALENAASIASLLITTDAVMAINPEAESPSGWQPPAGWRPPSKTGLNHKY